MPAWPTVAGLGGAIGALLAAGGLEAGQGMMGPVGAAVVWTVGFALAVTLTLLALGLSAGEWHAAGRVAARGRDGFRSSGGRDAAGRSAGPPLRPPAG